MSQVTTSRRALLVSVKKDADGLRICLDDIVSNIGVEKTWTQKEHVTNKAVAADAFEKMNFDDKELADFGYYILARLSAFIKREEN